MVTMTVRACAVFLGRVAFFARFAVLLDQRSDFGLVRAFSGFRDRCPEDAESGAQRDQLQHEGAGEEPGHVRAVSSRILVAKEYFRKVKCDFITNGSFNPVHSTADQSLRSVGCTHDFLQLMRYFHWDEGADTRSSAVSDRKLPREVTQGS